MARFGQGRWLARDPDDSEPQGGRDPKEAQKIGQAGEREEIGRVRVELQKQGYAEIYDSRQMNNRRRQIKQTLARGGTVRRQPIDWLLDVFPDGRSQPELVGIRRGQRKEILVVDLTAGPDTTIDWKPGDPRKLPNDAPSGEGGKHHLEKTKEYGRQVARGKPAELADFRVVVRDRYWRTGKYSKRVPIVQATTPATPASTTPTPTAGTPGARPQPSTKAAGTQGPAPKPGRSRRQGGGGGRGRGLGIVISLIAAFVSSKVEAAVGESRRERSTVKGNKDEDPITKNLKARGVEFIDFLARHPGAKVFANVTTDHEVFDEFVVAGGEALERTEDYGTSLVDIKFSLVPLHITWVTRDGSASEAGTTVHTYTTYPVELEVPPIEQIAAHGRLEGVELGALRGYASASRDEAARSGDRAGAQAAAHWRDVLAVVDADDLDLVLRARTDRLSEDDVAAYLERGIKQHPGSQGARLGELLALLDAPFEELVDYADQHGRPLAPLRAYAATRAAAAAKSSDPGAGAYWSDIVRQIDQR